LPSTRQVAAGRKGIFLKGGRVKRTAGGGCAAVPRVLAGCPGLQLRTKARIVMSTSRFKKRHVPRGEWSWAKPVTGGMGEERKKAELAPKRQKLIE